MRPYGYKRTHWGWCHCRYCRPNETSRSRETREAAQEASAQLESAIHPGELRLAEAEARGRLTSPVRLTTV